MEGPDALIKSSRNWKARRARAWETEILPARLDHYDPAWLDDQCLAGRAWARLEEMAERTARIVARRLSGRRPHPAPRRHGPLWASLAAPAEADTADRQRQGRGRFHSRARRLFLRRAGRRRLLRSQVEEALAELVALGLVTADSFAACARYSYSACASRLPAAADDVERPRSAWKTGRWALARRARATTFETEPVEHIARSLLRRYGVVFWRVLEREADWLPPWRSSCASIAGSKRAAKSGRPVRCRFSGEHFRSRKRSACCGRSGANRTRGHGCRYQAPIRSILLGSSLRGRSSPP